MGEKLSETSYPLYVGSLTRADWERMKAENAELRRKVEVLERRLSTERFVESEYEE